MQVTNYKDETMWPPPLRMTQSGIGCSFHIKWEKAEVVNSIYGVRNDFITQCWQMDWYFPRRQGSQEAGMPGGRNSLNKLLKMWNSLAWSGSYDKFRMARNKSMRGETERKSDSSAAPNAYLHRSCLKCLLCWQYVDRKEQEMRRVAGFHMASTILLTLQNVNKGYV